MDTAASPLWAALEGGVVDLEQSLARGGQGVSAVGLAIALSVTLMSEQVMGAVLMGVSALSLGWFTLSHHFLQKRQHVNVFRFASPIFEMFMPAAVVVVLVFTEGPAYALGSWVPPQLFAVFIAASILRLNPVLPALLGALAAVEYAILYFGLIRPQLGADPILLHAPAMNTTRAVSLFVTGLAGSMAVVGLRRAIRSASAEMRSQDLFGKYRIVRDIAQGGMGRVVEALYSPEGGFQRRVAIKLVHPDLAKNPAFIQGFRLEAELSSWLGHPNIVAALDFGSVDDTYFFAMEYVDGATLKTLLDHAAAVDEPVPVRIVVYIAREVVAGLHFAHAVAKDGEGHPLQVVHRDLSPANILVGRAGQVKLTDFGVAHVLRTASQEETSRPTELLIGKPSYMAPEQVKRGAIDPRTDLFTLGIVLWEALANKRLFRRENDLATLHAVLEEEVPSIASIRPDLRPHWGEFFEKALARDPEQRFQSATEVLDVLTAFQLLEGMATPEEVAQLVSATVDVPELELDTETVG